MSKYTDNIASLKGVCETAGSAWNAISPESAARMRAQNQFKTGLEIFCGERHPSRITTPCYPHYIEETGHNGATYFEHINFIENIEGRPTATATAAEGFWSIVVGAAAEESVKTGQAVQIAELLQQHGIPENFDQVE